MTFTNFEQTVLNQIWTGFDDRISQYTDYIRPQLAWRQLCFDIYHVWSHDIDDRTFPIPESLPWVYLIPPEHFDSSCERERLILHHWTNKMFFEGSDQRLNEDICNNTFNDLGEIDYQMSWLYDLAGRYGLSHPVWSDIMSLEDHIKAKLGYELKRPTALGKVMYSNSWLQLA